MIKSAKVILVAVSSLLMTQTNAQDRNTSNVAEVDQFLSEKVRNYPVKDFHFEEEADTLELRSSKQDETSQDENQDDAVPQDEQFIKDRYDNNVRWLIALALEMLAVIILDVHYYRIYNQCEANYSNSPVAHTEWAKKQQAKKQKN